MSKQTKNGGIGCLTAVGIVFLVLKLLSIEPVAHWSWWWVLCPFWLPFALALLAFIGFCAFTAISCFRRRA